MTHDEIEAVFERCGPTYRAVLIGAAFGHDLLWSKIATQCGLDHAEHDFVRAHIRAIYPPNGEVDGTQPIHG